MSDTQRVIYKGDFNDKTLIVRYATCHDYNDVVDIDTMLYDGCDYLASSYFEWMGDPTTTCMLAEIQGEVVMFTLFRIVNELGTEMINGGQRIKNSYRKSGLLMEANRHMLLETKRIYPNLKFSYGSTAKFPNFVKGTPLHKAMQILVKMNHVLCVLPRDRAIAALDEEYPGLPRVTQLSLSQSMELFTAEVLHLLYPEGYMVNADNWSICPATSPDVRRIIKKLTVQVSGSQSSGDLSVSTTSTYLCQRGLMIEVKYAGVPIVGAIHAHIVRAIRQYAQSVCEQLVVSVQFPRTVASDGIISVLEQVFHGEVLGGISPIAHYNKVDMEYIVANW